MSHTCSQINLPICKIINEDGCLHRARSFEMPFFVLHNPSTVVFLICALLCAIHFYKATNRHYAALGRKEFALFFQVYILCILLDIFLVATEIKNSLLITLEFCLSSSATFTLFLGGLTPVFFLDIGVFKGIFILRISLFIYFTVITFLITVIPLGILVFLICLISALFVILYGLSQLFLLIKNNAEVWAYGTLSVAASFFVLGALFLIFGSDLICFICERYLDGLFFFHLLMFCSVIMVHKYWLSVCDFEAECAPLIKEPGMNHN